MYNKGRLLLKNKIQAHKENIKPPLVMDIQTLTHIEQRKEINQSENHIISFKFCSLELVLYIPVICEKLPLPNTSNDKPGSDWGREFAKRRQ